MFSVGPDTYYAQMLFQSFFRECYCMWFGRVGISVNVAWHKKCAAALNWIYAIQILMHLIESDSTPMSVCMLLCDNSRLHVLGIMEFEILQYRVSIDLK